MSQAGNHARQKIAVGAETRFQNPKLAELRASVVLAQEQAIAALQLNIRAAVLLEEISSGVRSVLIQALETELAVLEKIDPAVFTNAETMLTALERLKSFSSCE